MILGSEIHISPSLIATSQNRLGARRILTFHSSECCYHVIYYFYVTRMFFSRLNWWPQIAYRCGDLLRAVNALTHMWNLPLLSLFPKDTAKKRKVQNVAHKKPWLGVQCTCFKIYTTSKTSSLYAFLSKWIIIMKGKMVSIIHESWFTPSEPLKMHAFSFRSLSSYIYPVHVSPRHMKL